MLDEREREGRFWPLFRSSVRQPHLLAQTLFERSFGHETPQETGLACLLSRRIAPPRDCGSRSLQHSLGDDCGDIAYLLHRLTHDRFRPGARQIIDIKQPIRRREIVLE